MLISSVICNSQKKWKQFKSPSMMNKQNVAHPYNGILFSHKKEWCTNTFYNMDEP